jgi:polyribonucleotide nucleotidyltransferase
VQEGRQPDHQAGRKAAKDPWEIGSGQSRAIKAKLKDLIGKDIAAAYKLTDKSARSNALNAARDKAKDAFADAGRRRPRWSRSS